MTQQLSVEPQKKVLPFHHKVSDFPHFENLSARDSLLK